MELLPSRGVSLPDAWRWSREFLRPMWEQFAHLRDLQQLYEKCQHQQGLAFVEQLLLHLRITVRYNADELQRLPAGAFVAVANHPCGLLDGIVLLHVLGKARPELRAVANDLLAPLLPQLASQLILVSPERAAAGRNVPGVRRLLRHLHNDVRVLFGLLPIRSGTQRLGGCYKRRGYP
jgi:putative hemolysin